uniref:Chemokine interleukin-8-like domain-containing protein n=1 Tax=Neogobius melanostomus TaxID=47308 RepID=A0A8C6T4Z4_9GOBI
MRVSSCAVLCCVLLTCCCSAVMGQMVMDCCLQVKNKAVPKQAIVDYSVQEAGQGCAISAMILVTRRHRPLCVPTNQQWVKDVMRHVDKLRKHCHKTGYKKQRCEGVRRQ